MHDFKQQIFPCEKKFHSSKLKETEKTFTFILFVIWNLFNVSDFSAPAIQAGYFFPFRVNYNDVINNFCFSEYVSCNSQDETPFTQSMAPTMKRRTLPKWFLLVAF